MTEIELDKDVVRRVLATHYRSEGRNDGPSWLALLGHTKDSLWSLDLFRAESLLLKSHWVLVVMDVFTRRIIGFGVQPVAVDGPALCHMFNRTIAGQAVPKRLSYDNDPLFEFQRWQANLRILGIESVRSVSYSPVSHPFVERLIGTVRREYLDRRLGCFAPPIQWLSGNTSLDEVSAHVLAGKSESPLARDGFR